MLTTFKKLILNKIGSLSSIKHVIIYANQDGNSKLTNAIIERKLKVLATTRNWNTVNKLMELMLNL